MNSKQRCLDVMAGRPVDRVPVFPLLMFFAADRHGLTYREFASSGHALAEAQLRIRQTFAVDAITACSDAFRLSADLGGAIVFPESTPPHLAQPLVQSAADLRRLVRPDPLAAGSRMADRVDAVREMARAVGDDCLVLGWVDMPFAEACSACGVPQFMELLYEDPALAHAILDFLTECVIDFALAQLEAGAAMIGAGDAAASLISPAMYREFALPGERRVCEAVRAAGGLTKLHICGNTRALLEDMVHSAADLFNVDHMVPLEQACAVYGAAQRAYKGNLDPVVDMLQATPEQCARRSADCLRIAAGTRYMLSPGCEVPAGVSDAVFSAFCNTPARFAAGTI